MDKLDRIFYKRKKIIDNYCNQNISRLEECESLLRDLLSERDLPMNEKRGISRALNNLIEEKRGYLDMKRRG